MDARGYQYFISDDCNLQAASKKKRYTFPLFGLLIGSCKRQDKGKNLRFRAKELDAKRSCGHKSPPFEIMSTSNISVVVTIFLSLF